MGLNTKKSSSCASALDYALSQSRITYRELSAWTNIDPGSLSNFRRGKKAFTTDTVGDVIKALPIRARLIFVLTWALGEVGFLQYAGPFVNEVSSQYSEEDALD